VAWLEVPGFADAAQVREAYVGRLLARRDARDAWLPPLREAIARRPAQPQGSVSRPRPARQIWRRSP